MILIHGISLLWIVKRNFAVNEILHIFAFLLLLFCSAQAQCPDNNIVFHNQAMIDSFPIKFPNCKNLGPIGFSIRESEQGNITNACCHFSNL